MKTGIGRKISSTYSNFVLHWHTPPLGKYVPFKEVISYGIGGLGEQFVTFFGNQIMLTATSFLVGSAIGIKPMDLQYLAVLSTIFGFGITIARSYIIDNSHFKMGKFRPWLATLGIPTVLISVIFVWLPYDTMSYIQKVIAVFVCYNALQCFMPFYHQSYTDLAAVMSPNSHERTDIVAVTSIIWSFAPTLTGFAVPLLSQLTGGLNNINTYRIIHPVVAVVGLAVCYIAVFGTKERIVQAKTHVVEFKFIDAFRSVARNKYFWITSLAGWLGFLESAFSVIIGWTFIYGHPDRMGTYSIATTLIGNAALWAMILCPFAIRTIGKRNLLIWCNVANIVFIALLFPFFNNLYAMIVLYYLNGFVGAFALVYNTGINADMRDYQHWFTGERIDGMFGAVGIIGSFVGMFTGLVLPALYEKLGLHDNYDVLEVASFREDMFSVLIIASVIGAFLNCVPYFFYDLTETKHRGIVKVLKIRALFEDYGNGVLSDESIVSAIDIIDEAYSMLAERSEMVTKEDIKNAKRLPRATKEERAARKAAIAQAEMGYAQTEAQKKRTCAAMRAKIKALPEEEKAAAVAELKAYKLKMKDVSVCDFVVDEMQKFDTQRVELQVAAARITVAQGIEGIINADKSMLRKAKALPRSHHAEREIRADAVNLARATLGCKKQLKKNFPSGNAEHPSADIIKRAEAMPEDSFRQAFEKKRACKAYVNACSRYNRSVKVWLDANRLLTEKENYQHLDEIRCEYDAAKRRENEKAEIRSAELAKIEADRAADIERRRRERAEKKEKINK